MKEQHIVPTFGSNPTGLEVAVIGMSGRFPGARNVDEFWGNLKNGVESIGFFSDEELIENGVSPDIIKLSNYVKAKGFLEDIEYFDAFFFDYLPGDVELMDPQARIFHECAWEALENAGYIPDEYKGLIGIYAGSSFNIEWMKKLLNGWGKSSAKSEAVVMNLREYFSSKISYKFNLRGPSITVITACSTSLVAIHLACQGLLNGECNIALAGAATVSLPKKNGYLYNEGMITSPDGHCRAFDANSAGTVFGNGAGVVVLKILEDAVKSRDTIYAVIKGSAINNDGTQKIGFTAPGLRGQVEVIKSAHYMAEIEPESLSYIEAHGTGTRLGDSIEFEALTQAFHSDSKKFCRIGSVKTNVGHLETAAGVTGFIKTILSLKHKLIPPTLHFQSPNPEINFENSPFYVNTVLTPWETGRLPRRAGVNSFGIGGSNAYVILEEFIDPSAATPSKLTNLSKSRSFKLLTFSARAQIALERMMENFRQYLLNNSDVSLDDAAYTLHVGRKAFEYRTAIVCSNREDALEKLITINNFEICRFEKKITATAETAELLARVSAQEGPGLANLLENIGKLWMKGVKIDWEKFHSGEKPQRINLPTYPFMRQYYWLENNEKCPAVKVGKKMRPALETPYIAPASKLEETIAAIWQNFFGIEPIGVYDNFFELRGDSLKAMVLLSSIPNTLNIKMGIQKFFKNPTIQGMVECAGEINSEDFNIIEPAEQKEYYRLSPGQQGLYSFQMLHPDSLAYNENFAVVIDGELDSKKFQKTFKQLAMRHESLRTSFMTINGDQFQIIHENVELEFQYYPNEDKEIIKQFVRPFDLSRPPLFRIGLVKLAEKKHLLMIDIHHIITDGVSQQLMISEFLNLYTGKELPQLQSQYKDFSQWQNSGSFKEALKKQELYWITVFAKKVSELNLPTDFPRPMLQSTEGETISFNIDKVETDKVRCQAVKYGVTLYMLFLGVLNVLLQKLGENEDIVVGTVISGRKHKEMQNVVGFFVNILCLRNFPSRNKTFKNFLNEVKESTLKAFENQDYQFSRLEELSGIKRDPGRNPLFDVGFGFQGYNKPDDEFTGFSITSTANEKKTSKIDIMFSGKDKFDHLEFDVEYCTNLYLKETIDLFINYFKKILSVILEDPEKKIEDIKIMSSDKSQEIIKQIKEKNRDINIEFDLNFHE